MKLTNTIIIDINEEYNIIIIEKVKDFFEYYLEKKGYSNLYYMFGICNDWFSLNLRELSKEYIKQTTLIKFWID